MGMLRNNKFNIAHISQIPIVLHTIDAYSYCWNTWYYFFKKHAKNHGPIWFLSEEKEPDFADQVNHIKTGSGAWGKRLLKGLEDIPPHFFYMQEDFWAHSDLVFDHTITDLFTQYEMDCLRISWHHNHYAADKIENSLYKMRQLAAYTLSHQFALWSRDFLIPHIKSDDDPWKNEEDGSISINRNPHNIYILQNDWYTHAISQGRPIINPQTQLMMSEYIKHAQ